jgi:small-conductance mechanosensitive channel
LSEEIKVDEKLGRQIVGSLKLISIEEIASKRVVLKVGVRTKAGRQWEIANELQMMIKQALDSEGVPNVYVKNVSV